MTDLAQTVAELRELAAWLEADPAFNPATNKTYVSALRGAADTIDAQAARIAELEEALLDIHLDATDIEAPAEKLLMEIAAKARALTGKAKP